MKAQKILVVLLAVFLAGTGSAWAHWRGNVGVYVGPAWGPVWYPSPYYYPPQVIVVPPPQPTVYIEQQDVAPAAPAVTGQQYWYYCKSGKGYYPYVKECPEGWQKVLPQPEK
jgi:hypothetical protein